MRAVSILKGVRLFPLPPLKNQGPITKRLKFQVSNCGEGCPTSQVSKFLRAQDLRDAKVGGSGGPLLIGHRSGSVNRADRSELVGELVEVAH